MSILEFKCILCLILADGCIAGCSRLPHGSLLLRYCIVSIVNVYKCTIVKIHIRESMRQMEEDIMGGGGA
jgi:hypothetical protein